MFRSFDYDYDDLSRLTAISQGSTRLDSFIYDTDGLLLRRNEGVSGASRVTYGWDDIGRLTSQADVFSTAGSNVTWTFGHYNPASQIAKETRDNDAFASLAPANGSTSYAVNGLNQYSSVAGTTYTYDANGNLTSDGVSAYGYDVENRLTAVTKAGVSVTLSYDPLGRLSKIGGSAISDRTFLYDGDAMVAEYSSGGAMQQRWVHGPNAAADDPLIQFDHDGNVSWLHADHLGSIVALTDASGGNPAINRYDEYGVPAATNAGRFKYTGQVWLPEIGSTACPGLYYYKARFYSPCLGRFLQTDPVGYDGGINLYGYVDGDPVNDGDFAGLVGDCTGSNLDCGGVAAGSSGTSTASITGNTATLAMWNGEAQSSSDESSSNGSSLNGIQFALAEIPKPPADLPHGPYTPKPDVPGNRAGSFQGPPQESGPRSQAQWVPPKNGNAGYWKTQQPGQKGWARFRDGKPITPEEAHPKPEAQTARSQSFWQQYKILRIPLIGPLICLLFCESPAK